VNKKYGMIMPKEDFLEIVVKIHDDLVKDLDGVYAKKKLVVACQGTITETKDRLVKRANGWVLPYVPIRMFLREIFSEHSLHIYSDKYQHKFENTVTLARIDFLREIRFKIHGTHNL
jgi:hypothetical protein